MGALDNLGSSDQVSCGRRFEQLIGNSPSLEAVLEQVERVAPTDSTVLIQGETGTGKELIARAIHNISSRCGRSFVKLNCAAIPLDLLESELFGHERGAFTGAITQRIGRFELADKGTLFLDEVGDMSLKTQAKVLRALDEQRFLPVGASHPVHVDVRVIAATNKDLEEEIARGNFREDLFYRLNVIPFFVPPLRDRKEDIPLLVKEFLQQFGGGPRQPAGEQVSAVRVRFLLLGEAQRVVRPLVAARDQAAHLPRSLGHRRSFLVRYKHGAQNMGRVRRRPARAAGGAREVRSVRGGCTAR